MNPQLPRVSESIGVPQPADVSFLQDQLARRAGGILVAFNSALRLLLLEAGYTPGQRLAIGQVPLELMQRAADLAGVTLPPPYAPRETAASDFTAWNRAAPAGDPVAAAAASSAEPFEGPAARAGLLGESGQVVVWLLVALAVALILRKVA